MAPGNRNQSFAPHFGPCAKPKYLYTSLSEWNKLRGALVRSPLVSDFKINAIARDGAAVTFAYAGDDQRLERDLRQRGVALDTDPTGWLMTSAITSGQ